VKAFVGVTDADWYRNLSAPSLVRDEVNFWFPSARTGFSAVSRGELFVFKTHVDRGSSLGNRLVGVGTFAGYARLTVGEAWEFFGEGNGVGSETEFRERIGRYRREQWGPFEDPEVGCAVLNNTIFYTVDDMLVAPDDFASSVVRGKVYELDDLPVGHPVSMAVSDYFTAQSAEMLHAAGWRLEGGTHGLPRMTIPRIGQQSFKAVISENYGHRCALTGDKVRPVLEAAHIRSIQSGGEHRSDNGMLLRSDMHTLFDRGYISFDDRFRLRVSPALRERFGNGDWLYAREGTAINVPSRRVDQPAREFLEWHNVSVFVGG
jgi:putative restriction endonuclease